MADIFKPSRKKSQLLQLRSSYWKLRMQKLHSYIVTISSVDNYHHHNEFLILYSLLSQSCTEAVTGREAVSLLQLSIQGCAANDEPQLVGCTASQSLLIC